MKLRFEPETRRILELVQLLKPEGQAVYLVGGAVRDLVLGRPVKDLDFCLGSGSLELANAVRRELHAAGFTLDDERQTARVILHQGKPSETLLDFVSFSGDSLLDDLNHRDFTVNTLSIDLADLETIIDPLSGQQDLQRGILRQASAASLELDPLRALRGVRMRLDYGLQPDAATAAAMRQAGSRLGRVSGERVRDELIKILSLPGVAKNIAVLDEYGLLEAACPQVGVLKELPAIAPHIHSLWQHTLVLLDYLEAVVNFSLGKRAQSEAYKIDELLTALTPYAEGLEAHFSRPIQAGRPRYLLFYLAGLYHDAGKPASQGSKPDGSPHFYGHPKLGAEMANGLAEALLLGREEQDYLVKLVANHMRVHLLAYDGGAISPRAIYRYYKDLGSAGVDVALMSICDTLAARGEKLSEQTWHQELDATLTMLTAWFDQPTQMVRPQKLVTGDDLMKQFGLPPSRLLGELLEAIREAQVSGQVKDSAAAYRFAAEYLKEHERNTDAS